MSENDITYNDDEINSTEEFHKSDIEDEQHSKLYWVQKNLRAKFANWAKSHKVLASITILVFILAAFYLR